MKKLLFIAVLMVGGASYFKNNLGAMSDTHTLTTGWSLPTLGVGQFSDVTARISTMLPSFLQSTPPAPEPQYAAVQPAAAAPGTANGIRTASAPAAVAKSSGLGNIPPELVRFVNLSLLTTTPTGTQDLSPASRQALQQITAQARANPAAFKEQLSAMAKPPRTTQ
jgi:hypothetical protein